MKIIKEITYINLMGNIVKGNSKKILKEVMEILWEKINYQERNYIFEESIIF